MNYLGRTCKNNWLYIALSMVVAYVGALVSIKLFLLGFVLIGLMVYRRLSVSIIGICIGVFVGSYLYVTKEEAARVSPIEVPNVVQWTEYKVNGGVVRGFVKVGERRVYATYKVASEEEKEEMVAQSPHGQLYEVQAQFEEPRRAASEYGFSMERYLQSEGAYPYILSIERMVHVGRTDRFTILADMRFALQKHIEAHFPATLASEAEALLIGVQDHVDEELNRAYQQLGITHLFAISGLHVALLSLLFYRGVLRLGVRREMATVVLAIVLPMYAFLAGGAPSVWRAVLVVELLLAVRFLKGRLPIIDALALSCILFLLIEPHAILQIGFQLSYIATLSLILSHKMLQRVPSWWKQGFVMTTVCQLLAYPLLLVHFYSVSVSSFVANIVFVPLFSFVILPINVVLLVVTFVSERVAQMLFVVYEPMRIWLTEFILFCNELPYQLWIPGKPSGAWLIVLYGSVFATFLLWEKRAKLYVVMLVCLVPCVLFHFRYMAENELNVSFIDVGQGDSILIELPRRKAVYLIDSGGVLRFLQEDWQQREKLYEVGRQVVVPYLKGKGIRYIDVIVVSHADADHVEGTEEVLAELSVGEIHITPGALEENVLDDLLQEAAQRGVPIVEKMAGEEWQIGDVQFMYMSPQDTVYEGNNDSLVLWMGYGAFKALFPGDLEAEGEQALMQQYGQLLSDVTVLKAGHHGSKTSSSEAFVQCLRPKIVIFMAGQNNRYGHPHLEIQERFEQLGTETLNTAEVGTIEITTNGEEIQMQTFALPNEQ